MLYMWIHNPLKSHQYCKAVLNCQAVVEKKYVLMFDLEKEKSVGLVKAKTVTKCFALCQKLHAESEDTLSEETDFEVLLVHVLVDKNSLTIIAEKRPNEAFLDWA